MNILFELLYNLGILVSISIISGFIGHQGNADWRRSIVQGLIFGSASIIGMLYPFVVAPGLIFDGRSVMISISGLFFGPLASLIAGLMALVVRIHQGGAGVVMGALVIGASFVIGNLFYIRNVRNNQKITTKLLVIMGMIVHVIMILLMFTLPDGKGIGTVKLVGIPILLCYPMATVLIGKILVEANERRRIINALKETENQLNRALDHAPIPIMLRTDDGKVLKISRKWTEITGYTLKDIPTIADWTAKAYGEKQEEMEKRILESYDSNKPQIEGEYRILAADGSIRIWQIDMANLGGILDGRKLAMITAMDITDRKREENALKISEEKYRLLTEYTSDVIWVFNIKKNEFTYVSPSVFQLRGITAEEAMKETLEDSLCQESLAVVKDAIAASIDEFIQNPNSNDYYIYEIQQPCKNGDLIWIEVSAKYRCNTDLEIEIVGVSRNIENRKKIEKEIRYLSYHDQVTGIYNRRYYEEELEKFDTKENLPLTIVMGDVNGLKLINDSFGHAMGDELLKKVAELIKNGSRDGDLVARLGGDEFVIVLPKTNGIETESLIKHIKELSLNEKVGVVDISISFGYDTKNHEEEKLEEVFKKAEDKMYKKKLFESPRMRGKAISAIIETLHEKNKREEKHSYRVSELSERIGVALGMPEYETEELKIVGLFHDIGKIAIEENILNKPGKLTDEEWISIERHPEIGYRILCTVDNMFEIAEYVLYHHERWDGNGYPKGLQKEEIPLVARIIAIADSYDAMTSERSYGSALPEKVALEELRKNAGTQFDPALVTVFIEKVLAK